MVALFRRPIDLNRRRSLMDTRVPLARLAADESVEIFEPAAAGRPLVERPDRAGLPHRHFMAFAELGGVVAVQLERLGKRRRRVWENGIIARCTGCNFGDPAHSDRAMVAPGQQRLSGRGTECGSVEATILKPARREAFCVWRLARTAECAACAEADVVDQNNENVRGALRWPKLRYGREA